MRRLFSDLMIVLMLGLIWVQLQPAHSPGHPVAAVFGQLEQALSQVRVGL